MEEKLRIVLQLTKEDMGQFSVEQNKKKAYLVIAVIIFGITNLLYGIVGWMIKIPQNFLGPIGIIVIALIAPMFFIDKMLFKKGEENFEKIKENFPDIELNINQNTIFMSVGETRTKYEWANIFKLKEYGSCFCLLVNKTTGTLIPKRFLEGDEAETIRSFAGAKLDKHC